MLRNRSVKFAVTLIATAFPFMLNPKAVAGPPGSPPVIDSVIVGGSQSPSSSVTRTYEAIAPGCTNQARLYVRWYVTSVNRSQVFVDRIYVSFRPNNDGEWYGYRLRDGNRVEVQTEAPGDTVGGLTFVPANTSIAGYIEVNRWVNWGINNSITLEPEYSITRTPSNTPAACGARLVELFGLVRR